MNGDAASDLIRLPKELGRACMAFIGEGRLLIEILVSVYRTYGLIGGCVLFVFLPFY